jgi:hypothetical protein
MVCSEEKKSIYSEDYHRRWMPDICDKLKQSTMENHSNFASEAAERNPEEPNNSENENEEGTDPIPVAKDADEDVRPGAKASDNPKK